LTAEAELLEAEMQIALTLLPAAVVLFPLTAADYTATQRMILVK